MTCVSPRVAEAEWLVPRLRVHERKEKLLPVLRACLEGAPLCHLLCHQHRAGGRRREHHTRLLHHLDQFVDGELFWTCRKVLSFTAGLWGGGGFFPPRPRGGGR